MSGNACVTRSFAAVYDLCRVSAAHCRACCLGTASTPRSFLAALPVLFVAMACLAMGLVLASASATAGIMHCAHHAVRALQERLEDHRRQEASRALVVSERETVRAGVLAAIQKRLAGVKGLLPVLRALRVPVEGEPTPTQTQILKCAGDI